MRNKILITLVFVTLYHTYCYSAQQNTDSLRVGLVLSGGGAKGAAHIGAIKLLEEIGISVDYVVGTSMGAVIGGMHSLGYSANNLDTIISGCDWNMLMSDKVERRYIVYKDKEIDNKTLIEVSIKRDKDKALKSRLPAGVISGENIYNLFSMFMVGFPERIQFSELSIPFACVATDIVTGKYVVLEEGLLPLAIRASMSIPEVFAPVKYDNMLLVDGGVVNNYPVNVALEKDVDFIIGVDVQSPLSSKDKLTSVTSVMGQLIGLMGNDLYIENLSKTDILITPELTDYSTFSFSQKDIRKIIDLGYEAALEKKDELLALKAQLVKAKNTKHIETIDLFNSDVYVSKIICEGLNKEECDWALKRAKLKDSSFVNSEIIYRAIGKLYGTGVYSYVTFNIVDSLDTNILKLNFNKKQANNYGFGLRYDSEEAISLFLSLRFKQSNLYGSSYNISGALSINPYANIGYYFTPRHFTQLGVNYRFNYTDMNIYKRASTSDNLTFVYNGLDLYISTNNKRNYRLYGGLKVEDFRLNNLEDINVDEKDFIMLNTRTVLSTFVKADIDNRNDAYFPTKGVLSKNSFSYYWNSLKGDIKPFSALYLSFTGTVPIYDNLIMEPSFYGRLLFGDKIPIVYANYLGGERDGRYLSQQISFVGINNADLFDNTLFVVGVSLRQRIKNRSYIYVMSDYAINSHRIKNIFNDINIWGIGAKYSYNSKFGPLSLTAHWSDYSKRFGVYINLGYYF
ncbi:MAG: patatin-like phospholipase family protein [Rikenellaceae bacterium]